MLLSPSMLSADFADLARSVKQCEDGGADYNHIDVMDGNFVPNISFGAPVMKSLDGKSNLRYDVHLMIQHPEVYAERFVTPQTEFIVFHAECDGAKEIGLKEMALKIKSLGVKVGVSIKPKTEVCEITEILNDVDLVLVMTVEPGFGGQKFMADQVRKVTELATLKKQHSYSYLIEVDGGVNLENAKLLKDAGTDMIVAGSSVYGSEDPVETCRKFKAI